MLHKPDISGAYLILTKLAKTKTKLCVDISVEEYVMKPWSQLHNFCTTTRVGMT